MNRGDRRMEGAPARHAPGPARSGRDAGLMEWPGTGRCFEAQADGVPCPSLGASCDTCERGRFIGHTGVPAPELRS